jgi:hypothetical protein
MLLLPMPGRETIAATILFVLELRKTIDPERSPLEAVGGLLKIRQHDPSDPKLS